MIELNNNKRFATMACLSEHITSIPSFHVFHNTNQKVRCFNLFSGALFNIWDI